jgi:predicted O-linked N-acetylglucosamine transferase (SPINDLY family)
MKNFLVPLLDHHNHDDFEIYAFAEIIKEDEVTEFYKNSVDHWIKTNGMSDDALSDLIRSHEIDILIDLAGHTKGNRLGVFARKPAPVSVSMFGYGYTTGLSAIDYFVGDEKMFPEGSEHLFSEQTFPLKEGYSYRPAEGMGEVNSLPALDKGYVTFGTLTRSVRINHKTIRVWSEILKQVKGSKLILNSKSFVDPGFQQTMAARFSGEGIHSDRLIMGYDSPPWDVLRQIDISFDCFPHNSGTTLCESLYMGIPFVTLAGRPSVGRIGAAVLTGAHHPEWIAETESEYIEKTVALASDLPELAHIRRQLRDEKQSQPFMDEALFVKKLEQTYRQMWQQWC